MRSALKATGIGGVDNYIPDPDCMRLGPTGDIEYLFTLSRPKEGGGLICKNMWSLDWESAEKAAPHGYTVDGIVYVQGDIRL